MRTKLEIIERSLIPSNIAGSEFTLFAPTDLAFGRYTELEQIRPGTPGAQKIFYGKLLSLIELS